VPLRPRDKVNQFHLDHYGMTWRDHLHTELTRRLGRSIRELQRLAAVLDVPAPWINLHRQGQVSLAALERIHALPAADQDDLMADLHQGVPVDVLVRDYGLQVDRKERRLRTTLAGILRDVKDGVECLQTRLAERPDVADVALKDLRPTVNNGTDIAAKDERTPAPIATPAEVAVDDLQQPDQNTDWVDTIDDALSGDLIIDNERSARMLDEWTRRMKREASRTRK
jgi:hypothetical protein